MNKKSAIVIGAGIAGLAAARALAVSGYKVDVFEKDGKANGASIRNFGLVWPVGQPAGHLYQRAMRTRSIWLEICEAANIWHHQKGSIHLANEEEEWQLLEEYYERNAHERDIKLLGASEIRALSPAVNTTKLKGGLYSTEEITIDSRNAINQLPGYFRETLDISFHFNVPVTHVETGIVWTGEYKMKCDEIYICGGSDFEHLYPDIYYSSPLTKCKLQMMRSVAQPAGFDMGPSVCGGLTLVNYATFRDYSAYNALKEKIYKQYPDHIRYGIHVMAAHNAAQEITIGDSHEYGLTHDPFDREDINKLIIEYLKTLIQLPDMRLQQTWNGTYTKMIEGTELVVRPEENITIVNGLGGAGMTLAFGLLEEIVDGKL